MLFANAEEYFGQGINEYWNKFLSIDNAGVVGGLMSFDLIVPIKNIF